MVLCVRPRMGGGGDRGGPTPPDEKLLQGEWRAVAVEVQGRQLTAEQVKAARVRVKGDKMTVTLGPGTVTESTIHLDPTKKPKALDLTPLAGEEKGTRCPAGIYELDGDSLRICVNDRPGGRSPARRSSSGSPGRRWWS